MRTTVLLVYAHPVRTGTGYYAGDGPLDVVILDVSGAHVADMLANRSPDGDAWRAVPGMDSLPLPGLWIWRGELRFDGPWSDADCDRVEWRGRWCRPSDDEVARLMTATPLHGARGLQLEDEDLDLVIPRRVPTITLEDEQLVDELTHSLGAVS